MPFDNVYMFISNCIAEHEFVWRVVACTSVSSDITALYKYVILSLFMLKYMNDFDGVLFRMSQLVATDLKDSTRPIIL